MTEEERRQEEADLQGKTSEEADLETENFNRLYGACFCADCCLDLVDSFLPAEGS